MILADEQSNYDTFRDCLSDVIIRKLAEPQKTTRRRAARGRKNAIKPVVRKEEPGNDAEELGEFIEYLSSEIFTSLPPDLRTLSYTAVRDDSRLRDKYSDPLPQATLDSILAPIPVEVADSLTGYGLITSLDADPSALSSFLTPTLTAYIASASSPPPVWVSTRASACEICERNWIPLTYHHLIPKGVHDRVKKRGWHDESMLNSVAWLCRACHSFVHRMASNEELAKEWYTVERIMQRDDVQTWAKWVGGVRWKKR